MSVSSVYVPVRPSVRPILCMPMSKNVCPSVRLFCQLFLCINVCFILACVLEGLCACQKLIFSLSFYSIVYPPVHLHVFINLCICFCPSVCLSVHLYANFYVRLFVNLSVCMFVLRLCV